MRKYNKFLGIGIILLAINILIIFIMSDIKLLPILTGITSAPFFLLSALLVGVFVGPDSRRVDIYTDSGDSLKRRTTWSTKFILIALPCLIVCIISFILIYYINAYF